MSERVLIVEDEAKIARLVSDYLAQAGYRPHILSDGAFVIDWVRQNATDLIVLDLMLPNRDGLGLCREIRGFSQVPIIMVTARVDEIDRLLGLELGADDYVCKPFSPRELVARVKAVLRRRTPSLTTATGSTEDYLTLNEHRLQVQLCGTSIALTAIEFQLLKQLVSEPGRIFSRNQLMNVIYDDHRLVSDRTVDSHIKKLRRKLDDVSTDYHCIHSVYGVGYKYEPP